MTASAVIGRNFATTPLNVGDNMHYVVGWRPATKVNSPYCLTLSEVVRFTTPEDADGHMAYLEHHNTKRIWSYMVVAITTEVASETDPVDR